MITTHNSNKTNKKPGKSIWMLLVLVVVIVVSDFILFKSQPFGIKQVIYLVSIMVSAGLLTVAFKISEGIFTRFLPQIAFVLICSLLSYQFLLGDMKSNYIAVIGLSLLLVWHGSQSIASYKFSLPISILSVIALIVISKLLYGADVETLIVLFMVLSVSIALGEMASSGRGAQAAIASAQKRLLANDEMAPDEFSEDELDDFMEPDKNVDYAMVDVSGGDASHDWEYVLRELHNELKSMHDVDALFKNVLLFMSGAIDFDAAVVGMIQERTMNKISVFGPDEYTHSKVLGWSNELIGKLSRTSQPEVNQQEYVDDKGEVKNIYRIDVPVISNSKMIGLVTILRESMCFNEYEIK